jgi:branched-chain amino acid transport system ATP-binding protein
MNGSILSVLGITKSFGPTVAVSDVTFSVAHGEKLGIIGPNGSGKTTLMNCITGVVRPNAGKIVFDGTEVSDMSVHRRAQMGIARTFQIPRPFTGLSVAENMRVPLDFTPHAKAPSDRICELLALVGLQTRANDPAETLSQLELRKLELGRALALDPKLLIVDEVMAGLTESEIDEVLHTLKALNALGVTVLMIEHIMHAIMQFSERLLCIETGRVIADGRPAEVAADPEVRRVYFGQ